MDIILMLALAIGIVIFCSYAARAAFKADSRQRQNIEKRFNAIVGYLEDEKPDDPNP